MRKLSVLFAALCVLNSSFSKAQEKAVARVHYIFKHVNDTTQRDRHLRDEVVTYLGQHSSYYTSYSGVRANEEIERQLNDPTFDGKLIMRRRETRITDSYLIDKAEPSARQVAQVGGDAFALPCDFPQQEWSISTETKIIGGYTCQKATARYKGRDYIAWFAPDLPFSSGPWKLHGLPGLILDARDTKEEVVFEYAGFDKLENEDFPIQIPQKAIASTSKEVEKLRAAFAANPQAYIQSKNRSSQAVTVVGSGNGTAVRIGGSAATSAGSKIDASRIKSMHIQNSDDYKPSATTNNPIELTP